MLTMTHRLNITPEQAYALVVAALDVVTSTSEANLKRLRKERETSDSGRALTSPFISGEAVLTLAEALEAARPGIVARTYSIGKAQREAAK